MFRRAHVQCDDQSMGKEADARFCRVLFCREQAYVFQKLRKNNLSFLDQ